jgi:release factor glutamine methyltransferase
MLPITDPYEKSPNPIENPLHIFDYLLLSASYLKKKGVENPRLDAELLLCKVLGLDRVQLYIQGKEILTKDEVTLFRNLLARRAQREPLAYILNEKEFYGNAFYITPEVLIPRPDTETLVEWAIQWAMDLPFSWKKTTLLEIGTGSGCIAISLMMELGIPKEFTLTDISSQALDVTLKNLEKYQLQPSKHIFLHHGSLFENLKEEHFHLILSNPPYVALRDKDVLSPELSFEPQEALFSGPDGLEVIETMIAKGKKYLKADGIMVLEIGKGQSAQCRALAGKHGWRDIQTVKDYSNIDRCLVLYK